MKKKFTYKLSILLTVPVLYFMFFSGYKWIEKSETVPVMRTAGAKDFVHFILNVDYRDPRWRIENFINDYKGQLNFNGVQMYDIAEGTPELGTFDTSLSQDQIEAVDGLINLAHDHQLKSIYERTKISRLCYGMRLEFEVSSRGSTTENNGFCWQQCMSNTYTTDEGRTVLYASTSSSSPGWLCSGIYENFQQSGYYFFRPYNSALGTWHLKPMMKIKQSDFDPNSTTPVAAIVTYNLKNHRIDSTIIKVMNFKNDTGNYAGNYINEFFSLPLQFSGDTGITCNTCLNEGNYPGYDKDSCMVDYKIYWYGNVDVWFDKLTVDDEIANTLLNDNRAGNFDEKIIDWATPDNFNYIIDIVKQKKFGYENTEPINHVLNVMYQKLHNQAIPITLK